MSSLSAVSPSAPVITVAFADPDAPTFARLRQHLFALTHTGKVSLWSLRQSLDTPVARIRVNTMLARTQLYIPLLSPDFVASPARYQQLVVAARLARERGMFVLPLLVRAMDIGSTPLANFAPVSLELTSSSPQRSFDATLQELTVSIRNGLLPPPSPLAPPSSPSPSPLPSTSPPPTQPRSVPFTKARPRSSMRVLCLFVTTPDYDALALDREQRTILAATRGSSLEVDVRTAATFADVQRAILARDYDVVHFSGHHRPDCHLVMSDAEGGPELIRTEALAELIRGRASVLVLNACHSALFASRCRGIDYVVAMDGPLDDRCAVQFSDFFYRALAGGVTIKEAFRHGRLNATAGARGLAKPVLCGDFIARGGRAPFPVSAPATPIFQASA